MDDKRRNGKVRGIVTSMTELKSARTDVIGYVMQVMEVMGRRCKTLVRGEVMEKAELKKAVTMLMLCVAENVELLGGFGKEGERWTVR